MRNKSYGTFAQQTVGNYIFRGCDSVTSTDKSYINGVSGECPNPVYLGDGTEFFEHCSKYYGNKSYEPDNLDCNEL
jgi:hypothetical protein